ncbi:hypothetical protein HDU83_001451 [Entophlyctis luteolus]|nr:hypothetical protein HDU83_001451 [Entophlyctis luteolus]
MSTRGGTSQIPVDDSGPAVVFKAVVSGQPLMRKFTWPAANSSLQGLKGRINDLFMFDRTMNYRVSYMLPSSQVENIISTDGDLAMLLFASSSAGQNASCIRLHLTPAPASQNTTISEGVSEDVESDSDSFEILSSTGHDLESHGDLVDITSSRTDLERNELISDVSGIHMTMPVSTVVIPERGFDETSNVESVEAVYDDLLSVEGSNLEANQVENPFLDPVVDALVESVTQSMMLEKDGNPPSEAAESNFADLLAHPPVDGSGILTEPTNVQLECAGSSLTDTSETSDLENVLTPSGEHAGTVKSRGITIEHPIIGSTASDTTSVTPPDEIEAFCQEITPLLKTLLDRLEAKPHLIPLLMERVPETLGRFKFALTVESPSGNVIGSSTDHLSDPTHHFTRHAEALRRLQSQHLEQQRILLEHLSLGRHPPNLPPPPLVPPQFPPQFHLPPHFPPTFPHVISHHPRFPAPNPPYMAPYAQLRRERHNHAPHYRMSPFQTPSGIHAEGEASTTETKWIGVSCNGCRTSGFSGHRFKCSKCPDYDLCLKCFSHRSIDHPDAHKFYKLTSFDEINKTVFCDGCKIRGIVGDRFKCLDCLDYDLCGLCAANKAAIHPNHGFQMMRKEKVALLSRSFEPEKYIWAGVVCDGCETSNFVGRRYKCQDCPDFDFCETCFVSGKAHTHANFIELETLDQLHRHVGCDSCGQFGIVGSRYCCVDCPNFDLCQRCISSAKEFHIPGHWFNRYDALSKRVARRVAMISQDDAERASIESTVLQPTPVDQNESQTSSVRVIPIQVAPKCAVNASGNVSAEESASVEGPQGVPSTLSGPSWASVASTFAPASSGSSTFPGAFPKVDANSNESTNPNASSSQEDDFAIQQVSLYEMGFGDQQLNASLLVKHNGNLVFVCEDIVEMISEGKYPTSSQVLRSVEDDRESIDSRSDSDVDEFDRNWRF